jgi:predicted secreted protein
LLGLTVAGLFAVACFGRPGAAQEPKAPEPAKVIDVAICLDVSNSMDGLIDSAKKKLWDIVNDLAKAKPSPKIRVAVYSYGNTGYDSKSGWVKKDLDLTADLDKVSESLFGLRTNGGNEYVARVCRDAVDQLQWSADPGALKILFVCGNEPADQDRQIA